MTLGQIVLLVYAILMIVGGLMGYRSGSNASLIAGGTSGILLLVAWWVTRSNLTMGLWAGAAIGLLLCVSFGMRLAKTGKMMPAGGLLALSVVVCIVLAWSASRSGSA